MEYIREILIKNEEETREFGLNLAKELAEGDVIALIGDLGTGKTALTRYIAEGLGIEDRISSPTFVIIKEYMGRLPLYHFDVYRLVENTIGEIKSEVDIEDTYKVSDALQNIGCDEYFYGDGVCVIEWANLILNDLPKDTKFIEITYTKNEGERIYRCTF